MRYLTLLRLRLKAWREHGHILQVSELVAMKERELVEARAYLDALVRKRRRTLAHIAQRTDPQVLIREIGRTE